MPLTIKVTYGSDTRRITVQSTPSFSQLHAMIKNMYKFSEEEIAVRYVDEDEELVRITSDEELEEAFQTLKKTKVASDRRLLRLYATKTGDEDPTASQLVQLLSSMSGPSLAQSVSQLNMLASLLQNPQVSQLLPALGRPPSSPLSSPAQQGSFEIPDWSRQSVVGCLSRPSSSGSSSPKPATATTPAVSTEIKSLKADMERLSTSVKPANGANGAARQPYTVAGRPYEFNPSARVVAEPSSNPGPAMPTVRQPRATPAAFDSFGFEPIEVDVPVEVEVPPLQPIQPIHPNVVSPFPALSYGASRPEDVKEETIVAETEIEQLSFLEVQPQKQSETPVAQEKTPEELAATAKLAADADAKRNAAEAQIEANRQAELAAAEAKRAQAAVEAQRFAEAEAQRHAEAEAKTAAEVEAKMAAEAEAKMVAEAEAKAAAAKKAAETNAAAAALAEKKATQAPTSQKVKYQARFVRDLYVVDQQEMKPFEKFVRGWVMCNDGYAEWPVGTQMTWVAGDKLSQHLQKSVPVVKPGETLEISMEMCAPGKPGRYVGYYRLALPNGNRFGHRVWVDIMVKEPAPQFSMPSSSHFVPAPSAPQPTEVEVPARFAKVFESLQTMGFSDKEQILAALEKHDGNIERALEQLLQGMVQ